MQDRSGNNICVLCAGDGNPKSEERTKLEAAQVEPPAEVAMKESSSEGLYNYYTTLLKCSRTRLIKRVNCNCRSSTFGWS